MGSSLFDLVADRLEHHTLLDRLSARGTLRLAIKAAGLVPEKLTPKQVEVVFDRIMPDELDKRGIRDAVTACRAVLDDVAGSEVFQQAETPADPDEVFRRLGGG